jgi:hypothetical protein
VTTFFQRLMLKRAICAAILWMAVVGCAPRSDVPPFPAEDRKLAWETGHTFVGCAAFQWALAETQSDPDIRQSVHDGGNGAWIAAVSAFELMMPRAEVIAFTENQTNAQLAYWRAAIKVADASFEAPAKAQTQKCLELRELQGQLVAEMSARVHGIER